MSTKGQLFDVELEQRARVARQLVGTSFALSAIEAMEEFGELLGPLHTPALSPIEALDWDDALGRLTAVVTDYQPTETDVHGTPRDLQSSVAAGESKLQEVFVAGLTP